MGRAPCCEKKGLKKGPWTPEEDRVLVNYIQKNGHGSWRVLPNLAGLLRCGKSCRLRWTNYLKPDIRRGSFTEEEERTIIRLHAILGNRWSVIASQLFGRTDNEIKNYWNTHLKKRLLNMGIDPSTHAPRTDANGPGPQGFEVLTVARHKAQWENARLEAEARFSREMFSTSTSTYRTNNTVEAITISDSGRNNPPTDYFLKIWSSEAGKAFRKGCSSRNTNKSYNNSCHVFDLNHQNRGPDYQVLESYTLNTPISSGLVSNSVYCASTQHRCDWSLNPDNDPHPRNSVSAEWTRDSSVKTPDILPCSADMTMGQTERKVHEDSSSSAELGPAQVYYTGFSDLLLDYPDNNNNSCNIGGMTPELSTVFQEGYAWPWSDLNLEVSKDY